MTASLQMFSSFPREMSLDLQISKVGNNPILRMNLIFPLPLDEELACLMRSVKHVGNVVQKAFKGDGLTIALQVVDHGHFNTYCTKLHCNQDGKAAGQTVPHVHFHILPRKLEGDQFAQRNDAIYPELEKNEVSLKSKLETQVHVDSEENRQGRSMEAMEREATWLKGFFTE